MHLANSIDRKGLRDFGLLMAGFVALIFGLFIPWVWSLKYPSWPWMFSGLMLLLSLIYPKGLFYPYQGWMFLAEKLGRINTVILLSIVFYFVLFPISVVKKIFSKPIISFKPDEQLKSYRIKSRPTKKEDMEKPY